MANHEDKTTEVRLRQSVTAFLVFLIFMDALFTLPELFRPASSLSYERAVLILAIGFAVGAAIAGGLIRLFQSRVSGSLVIPVKSWHLDVGFGILFLLWVGVPALLSWRCSSLWEEAIKSRTASAAASDCFTNVLVLQRFEDGFLFGILVWTYWWAFVQERRRKGQLIIAVHSGNRWSVRGWPVTDSVMAVGFGLFLLYVFYGIFTLK